MINIQQVIGGWVIRWQKDTAIYTEIAITRNDVINRIKELMDPESKEYTH